MLKLIFIRAYKIKLDFVFTLLKWIDFLMYLLHIFHTPEKLEQALVHFCLSLSLSLCRPISVINAHTHPFLFLFKGNSFWWNFSLFYSLYALKDYRLHRNVTSILEINWRPLKEQSLLWFWMYSSLFHSCGWINGLIVVGS